MRTSPDEGDDYARGLQLRLLSSYLVAFAAVFIAASVVLHFAFVAVVMQQTKKRLVGVARAGVRSVVFGRPSLTVDRAEIQNTDLLGPGQGIQWLSLQGRVIAAEGLTPRPNESADFSSERVPIVDRTAHKVVGVVVATELGDEGAAPIRDLDATLLWGALVTTLVAAGAGASLVRRAVGPVERSFQSLNEFTANASHELLGPLAGIIANADAALRDSNCDPTVGRRRFAAIADGARQMSRLTNDLLLLARAERPLEHDLNQIDLSAAVRRLCEGYRSSLERAGLGFEVSVADGVVVYGNSDQIDRVITNLMDNAARYTPPGGFVKLQCVQRGDLAEISVTDSGLGVAPAHREHIFERFWRVDPFMKPKGSGLGLSIARALARRHGGDVRVTSTIGRGSTFTAAFPIAHTRT